MIRNPERVRRFEDDQIRAERRTFAENLAVFEALWEHARRLGVLPTADPLDGIEVDIQLAKALHARKPAGLDRTGA